ncbi:hypothetical protein Fcan01_00345 [Folsomia candida]|uniref:Uncharacterized protein n=1 Tax=Folsomia candida TaxID=158441 RepID=A0A226F116_FOLCA|nr:hypothetical protein Fcan01_00345 [Folsomia candida]
MVINQKSRHGVSGSSSPIKGKAPETNQLKSPDVILIVRDEKRETGGKSLYKKRACQKFERRLGNHNIQKRYKEICPVNSKAYFCSYCIETRTKIASFNEVTLHYYRRYQVYNTLMNYCMSHVVTPAMLCAWTTNLIASWYTLLRYFGRISFTLYSIHAQLAVNGIVLLLTA